MRKKTERPKKPSLLTYNLSLPLFAAARLHPPGPPLFGARPRARRGVAFPIICCFRCFPR